MEDRGRVEEDEGEVFKEQIGRAQSVEEPRKVAESNVTEPGVSDLDTSLSDVDGNDWERASEDDGSQRASSQRRKEGAGARSGSGKEKGD